MVSFLNDLHQSRFLGDTGKDGFVHISGRSITVIHYQGHFLLDLIRAHRSAQMTTHLFGELFAGLDKA